MSQIETFTPDQDPAIADKALHEHLVRGANMPLEVAEKAIDLVKKYGLKIDQFRHNNDDTIWVRIVNMTEDKSKANACDQELNDFWRKWMEGPRPYQP